MMLGCTPGDLLHLGVSEALTIYALATWWRWEPLDESESVPSKAGAIVLPNIPLEGPVPLPAWTLLAIEATGRTVIDSVRIDGSWLQLTEPRPVMIEQLFVMFADIEALRGSAAATLDKAQSGAKKEYANRMRVIGALVSLMLDETPGKKKFSVFISQNTIIDALVQRHKGDPGLSQRNLESVFAEAKKLLKA